MYRDNTLIPSEAIRLLALGMLASGPRLYAELASEVRHFASHIVGPSLELLASPLELLKVEGLVAVETRGDGESEGPLSITEAGRVEFEQLMAASLRAPGDQMGKFVLALKMRFLHLLSEESRQEQCALLVEVLQRELTRLAELRRHHGEAKGLFPSWLDLELELARRRLQWLRDNTGSQ